MKYRHAKKLVCSHYPKANLVTVPQVKERGSPNGNDSLKLYYYIAVEQDELGAPAGVLSGRQRLTSIAQAWIAAAQPLLPQKFPASSPVKKWPLRDAWVKKRNKREGARRNGVTLKRSTGKQLAK